MPLVILVALQSFSVWFVLWFGRKKDLEPEELGKWVVSALCFSIFTVGTFFVVRPWKDGGGNSGSSTRRIFDRAA